MLLAHHGLSMSFFDPPGIRNVVHGWSVQMFSYSGFVSLSALTRQSEGLTLPAMASKTIQISFPGELKGYIQRMVSGGRYQDESEVVREALRRMEAAELADELEQFDRAFAGGKHCSETEEDVQRVESAVRAGRKR
jgi:putative addiction module CopG family antidote